MHAIIYITLADASDAGAGLILTVVGMGIVLASLTLLLYLVKLLNKTIETLPKLIEAAKKPVEVNVSVTDPAGSGSMGSMGSMGATGETGATGASGGSGSDGTDEITPELIAVLTAAATAALGRPAVIHGVQRYHRPSGQVWRQQAIRNLTTGHRPNRYVGQRRR